MAATRRTPQREITTIDRVRTSVVKRLICDMTSYSMRQILAKDRNPDLSKVRLLAMYCVYTYVPLGPSFCGQAFGRDETTVDSAIRRVMALKETDSWVRAFLWRVEKELPWVETPPPLKIR